MAMMQEGQIAVRNGIPPLLQSLLAVAYAVMAPDGRVLAANDGFYFLLRQPAGTDIPNVAPHIINPAFAELAARTLAADNREIVHHGLVTFLDQAGESRSLFCTVYRLDDHIEFVGEHNLREYEHLFSTVMRLNDELAEQQRAVVRMNRELLRERDAQAVLLEKLTIAQNQLLQSEKMASLGQLAAGMAHEINNPIGFVHSNIGSLENYLNDILRLLAAYENAEGQLPEGPDRAALQRLRQEIDLAFLKEDVPILIRESREGIGRVKKIVQDLRNFSRVDSAQDWQWADLHAGIESTLNIVGHEIGHKADVVREYGTLPEVVCLPSQINQVFLNLLLNAAQAIGNERGKIIIRTGCEGDRVWVEIADNGCGIPETIRKRIFDPFFTTKPVGKGTGLGLSLSFGIIESHRGTIEVDSQPGRGSTFRITLPIRQPGVK